MTKRRGLLQGEDGHYRKGQLLKGPILPATALSLGNGPLFTTTLSFLSSRVIMGQQPTYEDENGFYSAILSPRKRCPPLCHLDRSAAQRRDLCVDASSWKCFSTERSRPVPPCPGSPWGVPWRDLQFLFI